MFFNLASKLFFSYDSKTMNTPELPVTDSSPKESIKSYLWDIVKYFVIAFIITLPIKMFIAQPFVVSGTSMVPTFEDKDYLIVDELSYHLRTPLRGEVIVFRFPQNPEKYYIKRIVGLPGETVDVRSEGVYVSTGTSTPLHVDDSFIHYPGGPATGKTTLKEGEYFVMGDNRAGSSDSRYWGAVTKNLIIGRVYVRVYPFSEAGYLPGEFLQETATSTT